MIDFLSTRHGIDDQTIRCARLITAIISNAITDAGEKPSREEIKNKRSTGHALRAMVFLFEDKGTFKLYASLIGLDAQNIREALLSDRKLHQSNAWKQLFNEQQRRFIQARYRWLKSNNADHDIDLLNEYYKDEDNES